MSLLHKFIVSFDKLFKKQKSEDESTSSYPYVKEGTDYDSVRDELKSLDLVCFRGSEGIADLITYLTKIKGAKKSKYKVWNKNKVYVPPDAFSHVGIIVKSDILNDPLIEPDTPYIFESTLSGTLTDGVYNVEGDAFSGVQLRNFDDVMDGYDSAADSRIAIAKLNRVNLEESYTPEELKEKFTALFNHYNGIPYDFNPVSLLSSMFKWFRHIRKSAESTASSTEWLFCSELVAVIYQELGIIPSDVNPRDVVPMDFFGYDADTHGVPCVIEPPQYITVHSDD